MAETTPAVELNFSNLNFSKKAALQMNGALFYDFLQKTGYEGVEVTQFRGLLMRRMLGKYAAEITRGLHAPFAGRTFPEVLGDLVFEIGGVKKIKRNIQGLAFTALMPEVRNGLKPMANFQEQIEKGDSEATSQLDAVLYPFSGDDLHPINYDEYSAPFRHRTFQLTAEVLYRWGISVNSEIPNDEAFEQMKQRMALHGFDMLTLDSLHARRTYLDKENQPYSLPEGFVEHVAMQGLFLNTHVSVGRLDSTNEDPDLREATIEEAQLLADANPAFWDTQQGEWIRLALKHFEGHRVMGEADTEPLPFRMTTEEPNSFELQNGQVVNLPKYHRQNELLREVKAAA